MINKAIAKLTDEMMRLTEEKEPFAVPIEEHLTSICTNDIVAAKILAEGKNIEGAIRELWKEAQKRRSGSHAVMSDEEVFEIVDNYFEIDQQAPQPPKVSKIDVFDLF